MKGMKTILPSLKEKKRYLTFEVISKDKIKDFSTLLSTIKQNMISILGELGVAKAGLWLLHEKWSMQRQRGIIRMNHKYINETKAALIMINKINGENVIIKSLGVSGTLKKAGIYLNQ